MSKTFQELDVLIKKYTSQIEFFDEKLKEFADEGGARVISYQQMHREAVSNLFDCQTQKNELREALANAASSTASGPAVGAATKKDAAKKDAPPIGFAKPITSWFLRTTNGQAVESISQNVPIFGTPKSLRCIGCDKYFGNPGALAAHELACKLRLISTPTSATSSSNPSSISELFAQRDARLQVVQDEPDVIRVDGRKKGGASIRKRYRASFKLKVVEMCDLITLQYRPKRGSQTIVSEMAGIDSSLVSRWTSSRESLKRFVKRTAGSKGAGNVGRVLFADSRGPKPLHPAAESMVMVKVDQARQKRMPVTARSLKSWMKSAVKSVEAQIAPDESKLRRPFVASNHWLVRFAERHSLVVRRATNKKETSIAERLPLIQQFHSKLQAFISADSLPGESSHLFYGRFLPENCFNMDQSPLFLDSTSNVTYEQRSAVTVGIAKRKGSDQRFATLTICVRLAGKPDNLVKQPFISIIFKGTGQRISAQEREAYAPGVFVDFQPKAWTDSETLQRWSDQFIDWTRMNCDGNRKLLFLDNLKAQTLGEFRDRLGNGNVKVWLLPPNCTDLIQPVDRHLAQHLKTRIRQLLEDKLASDGAFHERWLGKGDADLRAKDVRILMTHLVAEAWKQICRDRDFAELGLSTGCVMVRPTVDREREKIANIRITGLANDYAFPVASALDAPAQDAPIGEASAEEADAAEADGSVPADPPEEPLISLAAGEFQRLPKASGKSKRGSKTSAKRAKSRALSSGSSSDDAAALDSDKNDLSEDCLDVDEDDGDLEDTDAVSPMEEGIQDTDIFAQDLGLLQEHLADSTKRLDKPPLPPIPPGYSFVPQLEGAMRVSSIAKHKLYWRIPLGKAGDPDWIITEIIGGPPDPVALANGITMQLRCNSRLDR